VTIDLRYGRGTLGVVPPSGCVPTVIAKPPMPALTDLESPAETPLRMLPLRDFAMIQLTR
jgi:hypothetical protein